MAVCDETGDEEVCVPCTCGDVSWEREDGGIEVFLVAEFWAGFFAGDHGDVQDWDVRQADVVCDWIGSVLAFREEVDDLLVDWFWRVGLVVV